MQHLPRALLSGSDGCASRRDVAFEDIRHVVRVEADEDEVGLQLRDMAAQQPDFLTRVVAGDAEVDDVQVFAGKALPQQTLRLRRKRLVVGDAHADGD